MNDAALVAREIQDLATAVGDVAGAVRDRQPVEINVPAPLAPEIIINVPAAVPPLVEVNLPAPVVNIEPQSAPKIEVNLPAPVVNIDSQVNVPPAPPSAYEVRIIERDLQGNILSFLISPVA